MRFADLDIAMRIEERWPGLNDRLASTIQFLRLDAGDDRYGSSALREATVRQALDETERDRLPRGDRAAAGRAGASAWPPVALALAGSDRGRRPDSSRIALTRLILPFGGQEWPQQTHFVLDETNTTLKIARGDVVRAGGEGPARRQDARVGPGHLSLRRRHRERRAAPHPGRRRVPRAGSRRSTSRSASR